MIPILEINGHFFLGAKDPERLDLGGDGSPPSRWIKVPLRGETDEDRVTLCFADTDLYLIISLHEQRRHLARLPWVRKHVPITDKNHPDYWNEQYPKLIDGGCAQLHTVPLGKQSSFVAARVLGRYRQATTPLPQLKDALVRSMIMYCEALRFRVIREAFSGDLWETETHMAQAHGMLVKNWAYLSVLLWK